MLLSQKCQYAVRAVFEVAKRYGRGVVTIDEIAKVQAIPASFLAIILSQLRQGGIVSSKRGAEGGYLLARPPAGLGVGEVIRLVEGPLGPVRCVGDGSDVECLLRGKCVFMSMWKRAQEAMEEVYDGTTFQDLLDEEARMRQKHAQFVPCYSI